LISYSFDYSIFSKTTLMRFTLLIALLIQSCVLFSQSTFQLALGGAQEEFAYSFQQTEDNGYVVAGRTFSFGTGGWECYLSRFNSNGDTLWTKTYGNVLYDELQDVDTTSDGGFIAVGHTTTTDWDGNVYLIRTNANGVVLWSKEYGGSIGLSDKGYSVRETSDGGFIVTGTTETYGSGGDDVYVLKVNSTGAVQWTTTIGSAGTVSVMDAGREVQETNDGGFIVVGYTSAVDINFSDVYLIKLNSAGVVQWKKTYGGSSYDIGYTVQQTTDNGFIIGATTNSFGAGNWDAYLIKTDANGVLQWSKAYGKSGEDRAQCARQTPDGGYILCGRSNSFGAGNFDVALYRTDANGTLLWTKAYGGAGDDQGFYVRPNGASLVFCGYTVSFGAGIKDVFFAKSDANGNVGCNEITGTGFSTANPSTITSTAGTTSTGGTAISPSTATRNTLSAKTVMCSSPGACNVNANFTASSTTICSNGTVSFTNTSTGSTTQTWLVNGTSFSSSVNATRTFPNAGTYEIKLIASNGTCTDTNTVTILVSSPTTASISNSSCQSFTWPVNGQTYSQSGVYYATISNAAGCDSIITLNLTINQLTNTSETVSNCGNYTWPENGQTYTQSGTYTSTFTNTAGCLSTKTLILTINQPSSSVLTETALDSYVLNGQTYTQSGIYTQVIPNSAGCDSTITLNLTLDFTGISESIERSIIVYPNPTNDLLNVIIPTDSEEHYVLFDGRGRTLLEGRLNGTLSQISLKELPIGSYFLQVGNERFPLNVLKQ
jgi:PKD repeat protein